MSKERLVELLIEGHKQYLYYDDIADYLLANGVIVPPCKVGDKVYFPCEEEQSCLEEAIVSEEICIRYYCNDGGEFSHEHVGESVFLSREEAEAKLKE